MSLINRKLPFITDLINFLDSPFSLLCLIQETPTKQNCCVFVFAFMMDIRNYYCIMSPGSEFYHGDITIPSLSGRISSYQEFGIDHLRFSPMKINLVTEYLQISGSSALSFLVGSCNWKDGDQRVDWLIKIRRLLGHYQADN